eukprot:10278961-Alexandrium_andersonii.AAC.1
MGFRGGSEGAPRVFRNGSEGLRETIPMGVPCVVRGCSEVVPKRFREVARGWNSEEVPKGSEGVPK